MPTKFASLLRGGIQHEWDRRTVPQLDRASASCRPGLKKEGQLKSRGKKEEEKPAFLLLWNKGRKISFLPREVELKESTRKGRVKEREREREKASLVSFFFPFEGQFGLEGKRERSCLHFSVENCPRARNALKSGWDSLDSGEMQIYVLQKNAAEVQQCAVNDSKKVVGEC